MLRCVLQAPFAKLTAFTEHREDWLNGVFETCIRKVGGSNLCQDIGRSSLALDKRWASTLKQATRPPPKLLNPFLLPHGTYAQYEVTRTSILTF
jgi:hypothetical protein